MFARIKRSLTTQIAVPVTPPLPSLARWENEGGTVATKPEEVVVVSTEVWVKPPTDGQALDARGDQLMSDSSSDGTPPPRWLRLLEWRVLAVVAAVVLAGLITWGVIAGVTTGPVVAAVMYAVVLLIGASPVLVAGLLRGSEERRARREARSERPSRANRWRVRERPIVIIYANEVRFVGPVGIATNFDVE